MDEETPQRLRRRPALSCLACRRRKVKCDRGHPCARCVSMQTQCKYRTSDGEHPVRRNVPQSRPRESTASPQAVPAPTAAPDPHLGLSRPFSNNSDNLATENETPSPSSEIREVTSIGQVDSPSGHQHVAPLTRVPKTSSSLQDLCKRVQRLEEKSAVTDIPELAKSARTITEIRAGLAGSQIMLKKARVLKCSEWMGTAPEFKVVYGLAHWKGPGSSSDNDQTRVLIKEAEDYLQKCKKLSKRLKAERPSRCLLVSSQKPKLDPPSREVSDHMVAIYFQCFESVHRILHEPTFMKDYHEFWEGPDKFAPGERLKVLLVIALGYSLTEEAGPDTELRRSIEHWVYTVTAWLSGPLEKDRLDISGLQINCLAILARQVFSIGGDLIWMSIGSLVHRAMQIGLHRDPKHLPSMSLLEAETRRRLWYTIVEMIVQSSLDSAMPPRIGLDDFDTEVPSNINDTEMNGSTILLRPHSKGLYTSTAIQLQLIESLPIRLRVVQLLNGLHSELIYSDVLALNAEIMDACRAGQKFDRDHNEAGLTMFHSNLRDYFIRRFLIPLHFPFACEAVKNPLFHFSTKITLEVALRIIEPEPDVKFSRLMAIGGGIFKEGFRCATGVISLQLLQEIEEQRLEGMLHRPTQRLGIVRQAVEVIIAIAWERIRQGETNIKGPMFLSMLLAAADYVQSDALSDYQMAKSARDNLILCHNLLESRANSLSTVTSTDWTFTPDAVDVAQDDYGLDFNLDLFFPEMGFS
ncbi:hypothetical protein F5Y18DRAFT_169298 [Xylariaceae sp. FL1019]|nr:hypothetical protein F5Y18DRAFT_169298 [Xylariaceae sp. FL1019]